MADKHATPPTTKTETVCLTLREYQQLRQCSAALGSVFWLYEHHPSQIEQGGQAAMEILVARLRRLMEEIAERLDTEGAAPTPTWEKRQARNETDHTTTR